MWRQILSEIAALPRAKRREALARARESLPAEKTEEWNSSFSEDSLYEAWTTIEPMRELYKYNRRVIREFLDARPGWHIVEIGGGNGALWRDFFRENERGSFTLIDPQESAREAVKSALPGSLKFRVLAGRVEEAEIPPADLIVCGLMLHHVAGLDSNQRKRYGLEGPGKLELLERFLSSVRPGRGICILNESDVYTEIDLAPDDPLLIDRLIDSYITRAAPAVAASLEEPGLDPELGRRLEAILIHWCIGQVETAGTSLRLERDVFELDTPCWLRLLERAGARIISHRFTDDWNLFHQYVFTSVD